MLSKSWSFAASSWLSEWVPLGDLRRLPMTLNFREHFGVATKWNWRAAPYFLQDFVGCLEYLLVGSSFPCASLHQIYRNQTRNAFRALTVWGHIVECRGAQEADLQSHCETFFLTFEIFAWNISTCKIYFLSNSSLFRIEFSLNYISEWNVIQMLKNCLRDCGCTKGCVKHFWRTRHQEEVCVTHR